MEIGWQFWRSKDHLFPIGTLLLYTKKNTIVYTMVLTIVLTLVIIKNEVFRFVISFGS